MGSQSATHAGTRKQTRRRAADRSDDMVESNKAAGKSVLARFLRVCFMVTFGLVSSIAAVACIGLLGLPEALLSARRRKSAAALVVQFFWRLGMLCSPWIRVRKLDGVENR